MTAPETLAERLAKCVKPLAWEFTITTYGHKIAPGNFEERPSCEFWDAETILMRGPYRIIRLVDDRISRPGPELYRLDIGRRELKFPTLEAAQAAAQADHTASILAALDMDAIARMIAEAVEKEREECARFVDCGCDPAKKAAAVNSGDRWRACQEANCGAQDAAALRARARARLVAAADGWQDIATLKPDAGEVMLYLSEPWNYGGYGPDSSHIVMAEMNGDWWSVTGSPAALDLSRLAYFGATHWRPLPGPPSAPAQTEKEG